MIEVEIKVQVTDEQAKALIKNAQFISQKVLINEYYDSADFKLTTKGFWLRRRNGTFELKFPATKDGNFNINKSTPMHEINDEQEIMRILNLCEYKSLPIALAAEGYAVLYRFTTTRTTYTKDGFTIDFDHADFGDLIYSMCEIEILVESTNQTKQALDSLYSFVKQYGISTDHTEGKLGHYMRVKNPKHYHAIMSSQKNKD